MEQQNVNEAPEAWEGHGDDDANYGNPSFGKEEFLRAFNTRVMRDHPDFDKSVLAEFKRFFDLWEAELERVEQVSAQSAPKRLIKYLKF